MPILTRSYNPSKASMLFGFTEPIDSSTLTALRWLLSMSPSALIIEWQWKPQLEPGKRYKRYQLDAILMGLPF